MINAIIVLIISICIYFGLKSSVKHLKGEGACCGGGGSLTKIEPADKVPSHYKSSIDLCLPDISCSKCVEKITNSLNAQDGIWAKNINLRKKTAHILYKENITQEQIKSIITNAGYTVKP